MAIPSKFIKLTPELYEYVVAHGNNGDPIDMGGGAKKFQIRADGTLLRN